MKTLKLIFVITFLSLFAISCSKDDDQKTTVIPETRKNLLLKWSDSDNGLIATYTYDSSNKLINYKLNGNANNPPRDYNFAYNADGTLDKLVYASDGTILEKYTYNSEKKLIKKEGGQNAHQFTYNGNEVTHNYRSLVTNTGWREVYIYDAKGNTSEIKSYSNASNANPLGTYSGIIKYTYDDKNSASSSVPFAFMFPGSIVNNIKTDQYNTDTPSTYIYEYNADNYPVKRTNGNSVRSYEYQRL